MEGWSPLFRKSWTFAPFSEEDSDQTSGRQALCSSDTSLSREIYFFRQAILLAPGSAPARTTLSTRISRDWSAKIEEINWPAGGNLAERLK
jgi:hypothetical protein